MTRDQAEIIANAQRATSDFVDRAYAAMTPREAADWALAAKNMAAALHSLIGAAATDERRRAA